MTTRYVIRVDGLTEEAPAWLDESGARTTDRTKRDVIENLDDARTIRDNVVGQCGLEAARVMRLVRKPKPARFGYVTTSMPWEPGGGRDADGNHINTEVPDPLVPNSELWTMVGSAATPPTHGREGRLFWFWRRP